MNGLVFIHVFIPFLSWYHWHIFPKKTFRTGGAVREHLQPNSPIFLRGLFGFPRFPCGFSQPIDGSLAAPGRWVPWRIWARPRSASWCPRERFLTPNDLALRNWGNQLSSFVYIYNIYTLYMIYVCIYICICIYINICIYIIYTIYVYIHYICTHILISTNVSVYICIVIISFLAMESPAGDLVRQAHLRCGGDRAWGLSVAWQSL